MRRGGNDGGRKKEEEKEDVRGDSQDFLLNIVQNFETHQDRVLFQQVFNRLFC